jgi:hypothetical protein
MKYFYPGSPLTGAVEKIAKVNRKEISRTRMKHEYFLDYDFQTF